MSFFIPSHLQLHKKENEHMAMLLPWNAQAEERTREIFFTTAVNAAHAQNARSHARMHHERRLPPHRRGK
jgi:hypothetical protein